MATETTRRIFLVAVGAAAATGSEASDMEKVTGIGGLFFRAKDPKLSPNGIPITWALILSPRTATIRSGDRKRDRVRFNRSRRKQPTLATTPSSGW
jgi:hypothetical protein